ncbi:hAT transposon superfamily protein [Perilla frutescens var. hirtella]|nr:hAT transposon superfamily protein [Perilla frutescens var. hirtella]
MATSSLASAAQSSDSEMALKRKSNDVGCNYCISVDAENMDKIQCIECGKKMSGEVYRIKERSTHIRGNVASSTKASKEDQELCKNAINEAKLKKKRKKYEDEELRSQVNIHNYLDEEDMKSPRGLSHMDKFASPISPDACSSSEKSKLRELNINEALSKQRSDVVKEYMSRWVYEADISFDSVELDSFKLMVETIGQFGTGLVPPTRYEMTEPYLKKETDRTKDLLKRHEEEWKLNGCSIITNDWSDRKRRNIINLCVNSRLGSVFLSSKDFTHIAHTSEIIFGYVDNCIEEVGLDNVVQIVIGNAANNMGIAKLLKGKRPKIFWTSCAANTIDLMLESIAKQQRFQKIIDQAKTLTIFLYAHSNVLTLMRSHIKKKNIVRPGVTRFASTFLTLQSIHEKRVQLKTMFGSHEWEECNFSKSVEGKVAYTIVMSMDFWNGVTFCLQVFTPLIKVFRIVDGDRKPSMGFVYGEFVQAKEEIKIALNNLPKIYESIIEVIDAWIKDRLDSPLHLMAYVLNPFYHYKNPLLHLNKDISLGVLDCLDVLFPGDIDLQNIIMSEEFPKYREKKSIFGKALAEKARSLNDAKFDPVNWWSNFGAITPNLQRLAMKILSLASSSSCCERNWSEFEEVHTENINRLSSNQLNNYMFVRFNAILMSKQKREKDRNDVEVLLSHDSTHAQEWIVDGIDDDDVGDVEEHRSPTPKYQKIRELYEDDFESEDEEINENEDE